MDWNEDAIVRIRILWAEGHSTAEIGRRLGVSKNAVVGKAHRLNLPPRPSPIRRDANADSAPRPPAPRRVTGPTLPPLPVTAVHDAAEGAAVPEPVRAAAPPPVVARSPVLRPVAAPRSRTVNCCWPIGEPGTRSFRFCDSEALSGKPYCGAHAQLAYVKVRDRRDEAAA